MNVSAPIDRLEAQLAPMGHNIDITPLIEDQVFIIHCRGCQLTMGASTRNGAVSIPDGDIFFIPCQGDITLDDLRQAETEAMDAQWEAQEASTKLELIRTLADLQDVASIEQQGLG